MDYLYCDLETTSTVDLSYGEYAYAKGAKVLIFAYALNDGPVKIWQVQREPVPQDLIVHYQSVCFSPNYMAVFHNSSFDLVVLKHALDDFYIPPYKVHDTMVQAQLHGLPGSLKMLGEALGLEQDKKKIDLDSRIMRKFCIPTKTRVLATPETHPEDWEHFCQYAKNDIIAMREAHNRMPSYNTETERANWLMDQEINAQGIAVDMEFVNAATKLITTEITKLNVQMADITNGYVATATQRAAIMEWLKEHEGLELKDTQAQTVEAVLKKELTPRARDVLTLLQRASRTSNAKFFKLENMVCPDGRLRGALRFAGASRTGRWAGRLFQPQNLKRPDMDAQSVEKAIDDIAKNRADLFYDDITYITSNTLRGVLVAAPGKKLIVADYANIEGRIAAWVSDELWKSQAFRDFDHGRGSDLYRLAYAKAFNIPVDEVTKDQRFIGKIMELALGYGGGVGAFNTFAENFNVDLDDMAKNVMPTFTNMERTKAEQWYAKCVQSKRTFGLSYEAFVTCEVLKNKWRGAHPNLVFTWSDLQGCAEKAIKNKNRWYSKRKRYGFACRPDNTLVMALPSKRKLVYHDAQSGQDISYMGVNGYTRKWERIKTYGGKLMENLCQAIARDVLVHGMRNLMAQDYNLVLTVHDEVICEVPDTKEFSVEKAIALMTDLPKWAEGLPIAAAGYESKRYRKD